MQYMELCVFGLHSSFVMIVRISVLPLIIIIKSEVWITDHCLWLAHVTMICIVCIFFVLIIRHQHIIHVINWCLHDSNNNDNNINNCNDNGYYHDNNDDDGNNHDDYDDDDEDDDDDDYGNDGGQRQPCSDSRTTWHMYLSWCGTFGKLVFTIRCGT